MDKSHKEGIDGFLKLALPLLVAGGRRSLKTSLQNLTKVLVNQKQD